MSRFLKYSFLLGILISIIICANVAAIEPDDFNNDEEFWSRASLGLKAGPVYASQTGLQTESDGRWTAAFGGYFNYKLGRNGLFEIEVLYVEKGFSSIVGEADSLGVGVPGDTYDVDLTYLEIPLLLEYRPTEKQGLVPFIHGGPALTIYLDSHVQAGDILVDNNELMNKTDIGLVIGAGIFMPVGKGNFTLELRYTHGSIDLYDIGVQGVRNRTFAFLVGFGL